jgi:hypothetical protein
MAVISCYSLDDWLGKSSPNAATSDFRDWGTCIPIQN